MKKAEDVAMSDAKKEAEERQAKITEATDEVVKLLVSKEFITMDAVFVLKNALNRLQEAASYKPLKDIVG